MRVEEIQKGSREYTISHDSLHGMIKQLVANVLEANKYNISATAKCLGMARQSVYRYLK